LQGVESASELFLHRFERFVGAGFIVAPRKQPDGLFILRMGPIHGWVRPGYLRRGHKFRGPRIKRRFQLVRLGCRYHLSRLFLLQDAPVEEIRQLLNLGKFMLAAPANDVGKGRRCRGIGAGHSPAKKSSETGQ
jgi:hypothetical protein